MICSTVEAKSEWRNWLKKILHEAHERLTKAQERCKRTFDNRLCRQKEQVRAGDSVFLRIEKRDDSQTRQKLPPLAEGPLKVIEANSRVVTMKELTVR